MRKLYFLLFFVFSFISNAQIVNIPDTNFKAKLIALGIDTNSDGNIQLAEAHQVTHLNVGGQNINDLTGINDFINLTFLECAGNNLSTLNISGIINLAYLSCYNCNLISLNLNDLPNLTSLHCYANSLTSLNLNSLTNLEQLICDNNELINLDLSQLTNLNELYCWNNSLETLNIKNGAIETTTAIFNNPDLIYICCDEDQLQNIQDNLISYGMNNCNVNTYCTFNPGGTFNEISGNTKFDYDNNGCVVTDINYPNLNFDITDGTNSGSFIANSTGDYYIPVQDGNHTITPNLENPSYFNISPTNLTVDFPTQASPFIQDFCVTANGVHSDVEVVVVPTSPARPGFDAYYRIIYKNIGNQVGNGDITFKYFDDKTDYVSSSVAFDSQTNYGTESTLHWNYSNLMPFETRTIDVVLNVNSPMETPAVNNGDVLGIFSEITTTNTDEDLSNNSSSLRQVVVGSYDPNDKTCIEGETVDISIVGKYVHYVIRFENTGTYPAENIVVKDMIDTSKFDITTLVPLHGSHEFYTRIKDNKVEFIFGNINLDFNDATNDGYIAFKIKTLPTLSLGDTFSNDANIYFDYNFPITTNEYITTIQNVLSNQDFSFENEFVLFPNPATAILNISAKNQTEIQSVEIYNIVWQVVIAIPNSTKAIDVSSLETGTYFIKVNTEKGSTITKFLKE